MRSWFGSSLSYLVVYPLRAEKGKSEGGSSHLPKGRCPGGREGGQGLCLGLYSIKDSRVVGCREEKVLS